MNSLVVYLSLVAIALAKSTSFATQTYARPRTSARSGTNLLQSQRDLEWTSVTNAVNTAPDHSVTPHQTPLSAPVFIPTAISTQSRIDIKTTPAITTTYVSAGPVTYNAPNGHNSEASFNKAANSFRSSIHSSTIGGTNENTATTGPVLYNSANVYNSASGYNKAPNSYRASVHGNSVEIANENTAITGQIVYNALNDYNSASDYSSAPDFYKSSIHASSKRIEDKGTTRPVAYTTTPNNYNSASGYNTASNYYNAPIHGSSDKIANENNAVAGHVAYNAVNNYNSGSGYNAVSNSHSTPNHGTSVRPTYENNVADTVENPEIARRPDNQGKGQSSSNAHGIREQSTLLNRNAPVPTVYAYAIASAPLGSVYSQQTTQEKHSAPNSPSNTFITKEFSERSW